MSKWVTMKWKGAGMRRGERTMERHVINARLNCQCHDFGSICWFIRNKNFDYTPDMMTSANGCIFRISGLLWALMVSLICAWTNGWTNYRDAGDLRRHRAHHDVTVMCGYNTFRFYQLLLLQWLKSRPSPHDSQLFEVKTKYLVFSHYGDVIMGEIASQISCLTIVYSTVYSDADQRKHPSSASLAFVRGIHRGPVNSPHKWPLTRKMFPFDDVIMP